jgi:glutamate synthase domain-containing protein 2
MKTVFSNRELTHVYAQQYQHYGRSSNMFFEGAKIYSYGYHYLIAKFIDNETILINDTGYSNTTSKHISLVTSATSHKRQFFKTKTDLTQVHYTIKSYLQKIPKARENKEYYLNEIFDLFKSLNEYLEYTKTKTKVSKLKEYKEIKKIVQRLETEKETILKEVAELNKRKAQREKEKQKEKIELWRNHEIRYINRSAKSLLRLSLDKKQIETSKGVNIETKKAKVLYKLIEAGKDIKGFKLDYYTVIGIKDNVLKIGCHNIPLKEVQTIGKQIINL